MSTVKQLLKTCPEYIEIDAQDYEKNKTGKLQLKQKWHAQVYNTCLTKKLILGKNVNVDQNCGCYGWSCEWHMWYSNRYNYFK